MKTGSIRHVGLAAALVAGLALAVPSQAQQAIRIGGMDAPASDGGQALEAFARAVEELSGGTLQVETFHSARLGPFLEQVRNVRSGAQTAMLAWMEFLGGTYPETRVIGMPYVFRSFEHLQAFYKGDLFRPAVEAMERDGLVLLDPDWTWWRQDPRGFISSRPIFTPAEMEGLKLRVWESRPVIDTWAGFGANPIVVPRGEMYLAFRQGIIEGGPETIGVAYDERNVEIGKYYTQTEEYYQILNVFINKAYFDSLTPEQQEILREATRIGGETLREVSLAGYTEKRDRARLEHGVNIILPDLAPWREAGREILAGFEAAGDLPPGFVDAIAALEE